MFAEVERGEDEGAYVFADTLVGVVALVAVELAQSALVVHLLDRRGVADLVAASRRFEVALVVLFGEKSK